MTLRGKMLFMLLAMVAAAAAPAQADSWYAGAGLGVGHAADADSNVFSSIAMRTNGAVPVAGSYDSSHGLFQLFGGFRFDRYIAVEAGYVNLGRYTLNSISSQGAGFVGMSETDRVDALYVAAVGTYPVSRIVSVYGKLGLAHSRDKETCFVTGSVCPSASDTADEPMIGVGAEFPFTPVPWHPHWALRVEYDIYPSVGGSAEYTSGTFNLVTAEGLYEF